MDTVSDITRLISENTLLRAEVERLRAERDSFKRLYDSVVNYENARAEQAEARLREVVEIRRKWLADFCPGEHEHEPDCEHGASVDPILLAAQPGEVK